GLIAGTAGAAAPFALLGALLLAAAVLGLRGGGAPRASSVAPDPTPVRDREQEQEPADDAPLADRNRS
ncbi:MFS transporter, partial [Streptomyces cyaneofuscatus]